MRDNSHHQIAKESEPASTHDLAAEPAGDQSND